MNLTLKSRKQGSYELLSLFGSFLQLRKDLSILRGTKLVDVCEARRRYHAVCRRLAKMLIRLMRGTTLSVCRLAESKYWAAGPCGCLAFVSWSKPINLAPLAVGSIRESPSPCSETRSRAPMSEYRSTGFRYLVLEKSGRALFIQRR